MTITVKQISQFIEAWAPPHLAYTWDKVGLHTGDPNKEVNKLLLCLSVTPEAVRAAKKAKAEMIVAHHPRIWEPLTNLRTDNPKAQLCLDIAVAGIACFAAHTNLDVTEDGVSDALAKRLGLEGCTPLFASRTADLVKVVTFVPKTHLDRLRDALAEAGAGNIGRYSHCSFTSPGTGTFLPEAGSAPFSGKRGVINHEPEIRLEMIMKKNRISSVTQALLRTHPYEEPAFDLIPLANVDPNIGLGRIGSLKESMPFKDFAAMLQRALGLSYLIHYGALKRRVRRVAVLGGSGGGSIADLPDGIDVYVTGDIRYHDAQEALLRKICCIDAGHAATELPILDTLERRLQERWKDLKINLFREKGMGTLYTEV